jgi:hypothetical protein
MEATQASSSFNFQRIVIMIAIVMLIAAMIFIGYALYAQTSAMSWPPEKPKCPDFWTMDSDGKTCTAPKGIDDKTKCEYNGIPGGTQGMPACPT